MFRRVALGSAALGLLLTVPVMPGHGFGEPRVVPDTSFYFDNHRFDRYPDAVVVGVVDGETLVVQIEGEQKMRLIKLAGIQSLSPEETPYYEQAIELIRERILYRTVKLEGDKLLRNEDATGLVEAYVWLEGQQMNALLIRNGLARITPYSHNIKYDSYYGGLQEKARQARLGIWSRF
ncbi:MAG: thermonuclease family protein [Thermostichus sp. DG_1_6_bins_120]